MRFARSLLLSGVLIGLGACATTTRGPSPEPIGAAIQQPMRDLSLLREVSPPALLRASASPYALEKQESCATILEELSALDVALGPDIGAGTKLKGDSVSGMAASLISGAVGLPFRGVVRRVSGAEHRDKKMKAAVLAGMVRRGFLKGRASILCRQVARLP